MHEDWHNFTDDKPENVDLEEFISYPTKYRRPWLPTRRPCAMVLPRLTEGCGAHFVIGRFGSKVFALRFQTHSHYEYCGGNMLTSATLENLGTFKSDHHLFKLPDLRSFLGTSKSVGGVLAVAAVQHLLQRGCHHLEWNDVRGRFTYQIGMAAHALFNKVCTHSRSYTPLPFILVGPSLNEVPVEGKRFVVERMRVGCQTAIQFARQPDYLDRKFGVVSNVDISEVGPWLTRSNFVSSYMHVPYYTVQRPAGELSPRCVHGSFAATLVTPKETPTANSLVNNIQRHWSNINWGPTDLARARDRYKMAAVHDLVTQPRWRAH